MARRYFFKFKDNWKWLKIGEKEWHGCQKIKNYIYTIALRQKGDKGKKLGSFSKLSIVIDRYMCTE